MRGGGLPTLRRKLLLLWGIFVLPVISIPAVLLIRLLRPILLVRIGVVFTERIGHLTMNMELYFCERDAEVGQPTRRSADVWCEGVSVSNQFVLDKWKELATILPWSIGNGLVVANRWIPGSAAHEVVPAMNDRDINDLLPHSTPHIRFTEGELERGRDGLRALGIPDGAPIVCLFVRDGSYLRSVYPDGEWSYHDYRNSEIADFVLGAEALAARGFWVVRMGHTVDSKFESSSPQLIDYANSPVRSDFMDVFLGAVCDFAISTCAGWDGIPTLFRRPVVYVNMVPLGTAKTFQKDSMFLTKSHYCRRLERELTMREIVSRGLADEYCSKGFTDAGVELRSKTPAELRETFLEFSDQLNGNFERLPDDTQTQSKFWDLFPTDTTEQGLLQHNKIRTRYSDSYLRQNAWWLD